VGGGRILKKGYGRMNVVEILCTCIKMERWSWAPMVHVFNPSYSGGRDQKNHGSKSAQGNSSWDPTSKKPITKKSFWRGGVAQGVGPEFKP
jgi:hypothetical protein